MKKTMSNDKDAGTSETSTKANSAGLKRRDLLLSGSSLVAASALYLFLVLVVLNLSLR